MKWLTGAQPLVVVLRHGLTLLVALGLMSLGLRAAEQRAERREAELRLSVSSSSSSLLWLLPVKLSCQPDFGPARWPK